MWKETCADMKSKHTRKHTRKHIRKHTSLAGLFSHPHTSFCIYTRPFLYLHTSLFICTREKRATSHADVSKQTCIDSEKRPTNLQKRRINIAPIDVASWKNTTWAQVVSSHSRATPHADVPKETYINMKRDLQIHKRDIDTLLWFTRNSERQGHKFVVAQPQKVRHFACWRVYNALGAQRETPLRIFPRKLCVCERERESKREREKEREGVCVCRRVCVYLCVSVFVCFGVFTTPLGHSARPRCGSFPENYVRVCVCVWERERERERERKRGCVRVGVYV